MSMGGRANSNKDIIDLMFMFHSRNAESEKKKSKPYCTDLSVVMFVPPLLLSIPARLLKMLGGSW